VATLAATVARPPRRARLARLAAWHPEWWVFAVSILAGAWLALPAVVEVVSGAFVGHDHSSHTHETGVAGAGSFWASWTLGWRTWALMVVAMMLPVVAPQVRTVATRSLWSRRHRAAAYFVVGYLSGWLAVGGLLVVVPATLGSPAAPGLVAGSLAAAALWHVAPPRRRLMRRCAALRLGAPSGRAADLDCSQAGLRAGLRCLATCGPMMLAMVFSHSLLLMGALLAVMLGERARGPDPVRRAARPREAWVLVGLATVAGVTALLA
jgi:predicted metal-binding membrane protein